MHPTADYSSNQRTSRPNSSTMYTPVTSPTNPVAPPLSTKLPWHGAHLGLHQRSQYGQGSYQTFSQGRQQQQHYTPPIHGDLMYSTPTILSLFRRADESKFELNSLQRHQQQKNKTPQVYKDNIVQMPQSQWQMHMYHQQQSGPMAGLSGAGNAPVSITHHQRHQNPQGLIQDPNTGKRLYQGGLTPSGVSTGAWCVSTAQNHQETAQHYFETGERRQSAAPSPQGVAQHPTTGRLTHSSKFAFSNNPHKTSKVITKNPPRKAQKSRQFFTKQQVEMLNSRFEKSDFINKAEKDEMSKEIGLTSRQIHNWFQNKKTKIRIEKEEKKRLEARNLEEKKETLERIRRVREITEEQKKEYEKILELEKNYE